jgi:hypothetical protein
MVLSGEKLKRSASIQIRMEVFLTLTGDCAFEKKQQSVEIVRGTGFMSQDSDESEAPLRKILCCYERRANRALLKRRKLEDCSVAGWSS